MDAGFYGCDQLLLRLQLSQRGTMMTVRSAMASGLARDWGGILAAGGDVAAHIEWC